MLTIKLISTKYGETLYESVSGCVTVARPGHVAYDEMYEYAADAPRAVVEYSGVHQDETIAVMPTDRCFIMNANGSTISVVR